VTDRRTDRQTDKQTELQSPIRASIAASRGKNRLPTCCLAVELSTFSEAICRGLLSLILVSYILAAVQPPKPTGKLVTHRSMSVVPADGGDSTYDVVACVRNVVNHATVDAITDR